MGGLLSARLRSSGLKWGWGIFLGWGGGIYFGFRLLARLRSDRLKLRGRGFLGRVLGDLFWVQQSRLEAGAERGGRGYPPYTPFGICAYIPFGICHISHLGYYVAA